MSVQTPWKVLKEEQIVIWLIFGHNFAKSHMEDKVDSWIGQFQGFSVKWENVWVVYTKVELGNWLGIVF